MLEFIKDDFYKSLFFYGVDKWLMTKNKKYNKWEKKIELFTDCYKT